jgi:putative transposase
MILTYKVKHSFDLSNELKKAKQVAEFAIQTRTLSSKDVKQFGLKSVISNQILRKYSKNKKCKRINSVKLIIPNQGIALKSNTVSIPSLKISFPFDKAFEKINQIEIDNKFFYVSCSVKEQEPINFNSFIGVDRNATGHIAVCSIGTKIVKLGKKSFHTKSKYKHLRKRYQKSGNFKQLKKIKHRERNIVKDLNHKVSRKIVELALENSSAIKLENLKGIRKKNVGKICNFIKNNWNFYELEQFVEYKAKLLGVKVFYVDPYNTSKMCSRCGLIGERDKKTFKCPHCGHVDHADANASFNIAKANILNDRLRADRAARKGNSDIPKDAIVRKKLTSEPAQL